MKREFKVILKIETDKFKTKKDLASYVFNYLFSSDAQPYHAYASEKRTKNKYKEV